MPRWGGCAAGSFGLLICGMLGAAKQVILINGACRPLHLKFAKRARNCSLKLVRCAEDGSKMVMLPALDLGQKRLLPAVAINSLLNEHQHFIVVADSAVLLMGCRYPRRLRLPILSAHDQHDNIGLTSLPKTRDLWGAW